MRTSVRIFDSALHAVAIDALDEKIDIAIEAGIEEAKRLVPIDEGDLYDDIDIIDRSEGSGSYGTTLDYGPSVEFGNERGAPEQPFLRPSVDAMERALRG